MTRRKKAQPVEEVKQLSPLEMKLQQLPELMKTTDVASFFNYKQSLSARHFIKRNMADLQPLLLNGTYFIERHRFEALILGSRKSS